MSFSRNRGHFRETRDSTGEGDRMTVAAAEPASHSRRLQGVVLMVLAMLTIPAVDELRQGAERRPLAAVHWLGALCGRLHGRSAARIRPAWDPALSGRAARLAFIADRAPRHLHDALFPVDRAHPAGDRQRHL